MGGRIRELGSPTLEFLLDDHRQGCANTRECEGGDRDGEAHDDHTDEDAPRDAAARLGRVVVVRGHVFVNDVSRHRRLSGTQPLARHDLFSRRVEHRNARELGRAAAAALRERD